MNKEKMSHNACPVNCGARGTVLIWLLSSEVKGCLFFRYCFSLAGTIFFSSSFDSICRCYSSMRNFVSYLGGRFQIDSCYYSVTDYLDDLFSDVVFKQEVA